MKHTILIALLVFCIQANAQTRSSNSTRIKYQKAPAFVFKKVPSGSKSIFYGTWKTKEKYPLQLHLYQLKNKQGSSQAEQENVFRLDLFKSGNNSKRAPQFVCATHFEIYDSPTQPVSIYQLWLDPKTRKAPIIELSLQYNDFYGGGIITEFVIFPDGFSGKSALQQFDRWGNMRESGWMDYNDSLVDENGNLYLIDYEQHHEDPAQETKKTKLYWNGKQFAAKGDEKSN